jgi:hypothetical protein
MQLANVVKTVTAQGLGTINLGTNDFQSTVVVSHGLGGTPTNIQLAGNSALYNYSWESVGATTFTIRARHRSDTVDAGGAFVYWQASKEG